MSTVISQLELFPPLQAAIFDLDGTLLDSMWVWEAVDREFFSARGMVMPEDYPKALQPLTFRETAEYTIARFGLQESPLDIMDEWKRLSFCQYRDHVRLKPGAKQFLEALQARGVRLGVATNLSLQAAHAVLQQNGVLPLFQAVTSADEVPHGKRFPDIYLLAAQRLGVQPCHCIAYDDIADSVQGIHAAGMTACAMREPSIHQDWDEMKANFDTFLEGFM